MGKCTETILVVEDEELLRELLLTILEEKGYHVLTAGDGLEAVEIYKAQHERISLVLTDMGLPKLDGWEVFQQMKAINPTVRAIMASGYFETALRLEMLKAGAKDFIQKPYVPEKILNKIREVLDMK